MNETWGPCFRKRDWLCRSSYSRQRLSLFMLRIFSCFCLMSLLFLFVYLLLVVMCVALCTCWHQNPSSPSIVWTLGLRLLFMCIYLLRVGMCVVWCIYWHQNPFFPSIVWTLGLRLTSLAAEPSCWPSVLSLKCERSLCGERNEGNLRGNLGISESHACSWDVVILW